MQSNPPFSSAKLLPNRGRRRLASVLIAGLVSVATACAGTAGGQTTPEPTPIVLPDAPSPAATPTAPVSARFNVANTGGDGVNLRAEPNADAQIVSTLAEGTTVEQVGPDQQAEQYTWKHVKDGKGNIGWVAADFLTLVE